MNHLDLDLDPFLKTALEAAARATQIVSESAKGTLVVSTKSSPRDLVTQINHESERAIRDVISRYHPDHSILGEEGGLAGSIPYRWVVDPVDGTSNFARGIPHFAVSIGLEHGGQGLLGVIANPTLGDTYGAVQGQGAFKNGRWLSVSSCVDLSEAFVTMSFSADARASDRARPVWDGLLTRCQTLRRMGSTALELALLAEGKIDAFIGFGQGAWDVAAGTVLVREAGGEVRLFDGGRRYNLSRGGVTRDNRTAGNASTRLTPKLAKWCETLVRHCDYRSKTLCPYFHPCAS